MCCNQHIIEIITYVQCFGSLCISLLRRKVWRSRNELSGRDMKSELEAI